MSETVISATISSLGFLENNVYHPEPDCAAGILDLLRFLSNDGEDYLVRRMCLSRHVIKNDLVPIMVLEKTSYDDFKRVLRLTANLCQPALSIFRNQLPETEEKVNLYYELDGLISTVFNAFNSKKIFIKFNKVLTDFFDQEWTDRREIEKIECERVIMLLRFIFAAALEGPRNVEVSNAIIQSKRSMIFAFLSSGIHKTLIKIAGNRMEKELATHIMSIFSLLLRSFPCDRIALTEDSDEEQKAEKEKLLQQSLENDLNKIAKKRQSFSNRSFLGGNYVLKNAALNTKNDLLVHKAKTDDHLENLRARKQEKGATKRNQIRNFVGSVFQENRNVTQDLRVLVRGFCCDLINNGFDKLMKATRDNAFSVGRVGIHIYNDVNYFSLAKFVLEFVRLNKLPLDNASSVFSGDFFYHVISQSTTYLDSVKTDKQNLKLLVLRAQHSISAYKELNHLLYSISSSKIDREKELFEYMVEKIYYIDEYREFPYILLSNLKPQMMTKILLEDLISGAHYYIAVMEKIVKRGELNTVAKRKKIQKKKQKIQKKAKEAVEENDKSAEVDKMEEEKLKELWTEIKGEVNDCVTGKVQPTENMLPIDSTLKAEDAEHQTFALLNIQRALRTRRICDALGIFMAARDLWPDDAFGPSNSTEEQSMDNLFEIFEIDLTTTASKYADLKKQFFEELNKDEDQHKSVSDDEDSGDDEAEEEEKYKVTEIPFEFSDYIMNFTKADVINWYIFLLKSFNVNTEEVNKYSLKMLHRIAFDNNCHSRLYLATLFSIFLSVGAEIESFSKDRWKTHKFFELYQFGLYLMKKFLVTFKERGPRLINEILFSKTAKECFDIDHGYGEYEAKNSKGALDSLWPEELEEEVRTLYDEFNNLEVQDRPEGVDVVDYIQTSLTKERYPKQIKRQLKRMGLSFAKEKPKKERKVRKEKSKKSKNIEGIVSDSEEENIINDEEDEVPISSKFSKLVDSGDEEAMEEDKEEEILDNEASTSIHSLRIVESDEEDLNEDLNKTEKENEATQNSVNSLKRRKRMIDSDSEEEPGIETKRRLIHEED